MSDKPKAIYRHCQEVYGEMLKRSEPFADNPDFSLYTGFLTRLITEELALPTSYYTFITKELLRMDCIRIMRRGGGSSPSQWLLLKTPTQDDFENMPDLKRSLSKKEEIEEQFKRTTNERLDIIERNLGIK